MKQSKQTNRTLGWLCLVVGGLLLGFVLWKNFSGTNLLRDDMPSIIIALCAIVTGISILFQGYRRN